MVYRDIKEALDCPQHGALFADSRGHNKLVNSSMEGLLDSLNLTSLSRYETLASQLRQLATDKIVPAGIAGQGTSEGGIGDITSANFRINDPKGRTWILHRTQLADRGRFLTQLIALNVSKYMSLSQELSDEIDSFQERQNSLPRKLLASRKPSPSAWCCGLVPPFTALFPNGFLLYTVS